MSDGLSVFGYPVPEGSLRVQVLDEKGATRWKRLSDVLPTDAPLLGPDNRPRFMSGSIGRPPKTEVQLEAVTPAVANLIKAKAAMVKEDSLVQVAQDTPESPDLITEALSAMAEESASLRFERLEAERNGKDTSTISMRRVNVLKSLMDTYLKRLEIQQTRKVDLESSEFVALIGFIGETFSRSFDACGVPKTVADSVLAEVTREMDDPLWKMEARKRMETLK